MGKLRYQVLVLGLGNLLMTDDGFGVLAAQILMQKAWPSGVAVMDIGTAAFYFWEEISLSRHVIAIDALRAGGKPGSIYRLTGTDILHPLGGWRAAHGLTFPDVLTLAGEMSGYPTGVLIYGVEPLDLRFGHPLSPVLKKTLPEVVEQVVGEINRLLSAISYS